MMSDLKDKEKENTNSHWLQLPRSSKEGLEELEAYFKKNPVHIVIRPRKKGLK
ncbi:MAG: hypothetical protein ACQ9MH_27650 [Nitrospinales bacterium]